MYRLLKRGIDEVGPRPSCSDPEKKLGEMIRKEWRPFCDDVKRERFRCHPGAFTGHIPWVAIFYILGAVLYWFCPPAALISAFLSFSLIFFELLRYREYVDFLYPVREGVNVTGVIKPSGKVKKRIIVSAHLDSAYEFRVWYYLKNGAVALSILILLGLLVLMGGAAAKTVSFFAGYSYGAANTVIGIITTALIPAVAPFLVFASGKAVPGAMDNMAGIAVVSGTGRYLARSRNSGKGGNGGDNDEYLPVNTEVILLATSAEEAGLRGAKRYVEKHLSELREIPTYGLFLDGIYDEQHLTIINREYCGRGKHDPGLIRMAQDVAEDRGWPVKTNPIILGATDASAFSVKGIPSVCIGCQDITRLVPNYHTRLDTYDQVRPESLSVCMEMMVELIKRIDRS